MVDVFNSITKQIKDHERIVIMAHRHIDYDALGSALGLYEIVKSFGKEPAIYIDDDIKDALNPRIFELIDKLNINFIYEDTYRKFINKNTLLIIVDTHKEEMLSNKDLMPLVKNTIVIDHHIKSDEYIKDISFSYIDYNLSSICEFVAFYLKYLNKKVDTAVATVMLTGIELDTNDFHTKTTPKTFEAACFLTELGADTTDTLDLMKENKEETIKRMHYLSNSYTIDDKIMICPIHNEIVTPKDLAIISDMQLRITNIELAFSIGKIGDNKVGISARSGGRYDALQIMKLMGGGGHATEAATQIKNKSIKEVEKELIEIIKEVE